MCGDPEQHAQRQHHAHHIDLPHGERAARQHRHPARQPADDDRVRRPALEPDRVDHHVEEQTGEHDGAVDRRHRQRPADAQRREHQAENHGLAHAHLARRERPPARALHARVDVAVVGHVEHRAAADGQEQTAHQAEDRQPVPRGPDRAQVASDAGGEQQAGLKALDQRPVAAEGVLRIASNPQHSFYPPTHRSNPCPLPTCLPVCCRPVPLSFQFLIPDS